MHNHGSHTTLMFASVGAFVVLAAFGVPVLSYLPLLAVLVLCPLMMFFMMRGMDHGGRASGGGDDADRITGGHRH